ncbi:MAG TPA: bifunctional aldolase/short-chain dehydrogenase [Anaerolineales bacterium]|nr:bifunctional aldolase/short-chain dehydrogenase [Anaerolineales bacterium]
MPRNLWNEEEAQKRPELDGLVYRSNLLGRDRRVVNVYGGNTSAKIMETDHLGRPVEVLWVKGSGSDVADITEQGFAGLRLAEITPLIARQAMSDEEMVAYLSHCTHALNRPRQSIETLLHAFVPARHVDHTHPDAVISLACSSTGQELCQELWAERAVWIDYTRPGFTLSKWIAQGIQANPKAELVVMGKHGLLSWGETSQECYQRSIRVIQEAEDFIANRRQGRVIFPGNSVPALVAEQRRQVLARVLPELRGAVSKERPAILQVDDSPEVLAFTGSAGADNLSQVGAACPDHLVHTKRQPLFVDWRPEEGEEALPAGLAAGVESFVAAYAAYFAACSRAGDKIGDPYPRVILIPGIGLVTTGADAQAADVSRQLYQRAIQVMEGSQSLGQFVSLDPQEAYDVEYWPLELYKLTVKPPPRELAGRVAVVTGGASGIGRATAHRLAQDGAHVAIFDLNLEGAQAVAEEIDKAQGFRRGMAVHCDVTDEAAVVAAFKQVVLAYGGVDIVVSNAGIAISAPIEEVRLADWDRTLDILAKGYFLVSREAFRIWIRQRMGGSLVYVASKNSVVAAKNASVYGAAKAAELQMARCLAEEGGAYGIRVNVVMPDAVIQGSSIWNQGWRQARAAGYGIKPEELEEYYRQRTTLKVNVYPENIAEAISFLAGPRASRTTGGVLTVDGGVMAAYMR